MLWMLSLIGIGGQRGRWHRSAGVLVGVVMVMGVMARPAFAVAGRSARRRGGGSAVSRGLGAGAVRAIAGFEGFSASAYDDAAGDCVVGYGHLLHRGKCRAADRAKHVSRKRALSLLRADLARALAHVKRLVRVALSGPQLAALTGYLYNAGARAFAKSKLLKSLNKGGYAKASKALGHWWRKGSPTVGRGRPRRHVSKHAKTLLFSDSAPTASQCVLHCNASPRSGGSSTGATASGPGSKGSAGGSKSETGGESSGPAGEGSTPGGGPPETGGETSGCPTEGSLDALGRSGGSLTIPAGCSIVLTQPIVVAAGVRLELLGEGRPGAIGAGLDGEGRTQLMVIETGATVTLKDLSLFRGHASGAAGVAGENGQGGLSGQESGSGEGTAGTAGAAGGNGGNALGGAIENAGELTVVGCNFSEDSAEGGTGGGGGSGGNGGEGKHGSEPTGDGLEGSGGGDGTQGGNGGAGGDGGGGGAALGGAIYSSGALTVRESVFEGDTATGGSGGGGADGGEGGAGGAGGFGENSTTDAGSGGEGADAGVGGEGGSGGQAGEAAGGAIYSNGILTIEASSFRGETAGAGFGGFGANGGTGGNGGAGGGGGAGIGGPGKGAAVGGEGGNAGLAMAGGNGGAGGAGGKGSGGAICSSGTLTVAGSTFESDVAYGGQGQAAGRGGEGGQAGVGGFGGGLETGTGGSGGAAGNDSAQGDGGNGGQGGQSGAAVGGAIFYDAKGAFSVSASKFITDEATSVIGGTGGNGGAAGSGFAPPDGPEGGGAPEYTEEGVPKQGEGGAGGNGSDGARGGEGGDGGSAGQTLGGAIASSVAFTLEGRPVMSGGEAEADFHVDLSEDKGSPGQAPTGCPESYTEPQVVAGCAGVGGYASEAASAGGKGGEGKPPGAEGQPGEAGEEGKAGQPGQTGLEEGPAVHIAP